MSLTPYLSLLESLRDDLAANLTKMGVSASDTETLQTLVPKVLQIAQGNISQEVFVAQMHAFSVSYGYFSTGEICHFTGICQIQYYNKISFLTVTISGTGLSALTVTAPNWTVTSSESAITMIMATGTRFDAQAALDAIMVEGDDATDVLATITVTATMESGTQISADSATELIFSYGMTWKVLEDIGYTWAALEAENLTWTMLEEMGKPSHEEVAE